MLALTNQSERPNLYRLFNEARMDKLKKMPESKKVTVNSPIPSRKNTKNLNLTTAPNLIKISTIMLTISG